MKKLIFFLIFALFLINIVDACSPDAGLDWCYSGEITQWSPAHCYSEVQGSYPKCEGLEHGSYCIGSWYINVKHEGDKFYLQSQVNSWDEQKCDDNGCPGEMISDGKIFLQRSSGQVPKYTLAAWDKDETSESWCWNSYRGGYLGDYFSLYVVECYEASDCGLGKYCDKSGDWKTWNCKVKECESGEEKCVGSSLYKCEDYKWQNKGANPGECGYCNIIDDCLGKESPKGQKGEWLCENKLCVWKGTLWSKVASWFKNLFGKIRWF